MSDKQSHQPYINRPQAKEHRFDYNPPPPPSNPVIRGLPLHYLAQLVSWSGFLQKFLWANAGFAALRNRSELHDVEPRYEPAVIRTRSVNNSNSGAVEEEGYLAALSSQNWAAKAPGKAVFGSCLDYAKAYRDKSVTPTQVAEFLLPLLEEGKHATAFLSVNAELVREAAEASTKRWKAGEPLSPLDGIPMTVKDEEDLAGYPRSLGSKLDFTSKTNATSYCVQKWLDAGAVCIGKSTMHELGLDTTNNNPVHGTPLNPNNETYYCGGSSGGSAYAVAAGLVPFAMGNDGGGSIRIPAAYCGVFGLKPSQSRVSIRPTANLARSNGVAGPLTANMVDLELAYKVMAEPDLLDPASAQFAPPGSSSAAGRSKVLGIYKAWFDRADEPVRGACQKAIDYLTDKLGYEVVDISIPLLPEGQLAHAMTIMAEIASGVSSVRDLMPANKTLLSLAKQTTGVDFIQAQKVRHLLMQHFAHLFEKHPGLIVVTPTTPNAGWHFEPADLAYGISDGNMQMRNMEYVWLANFVGIPALSSPVGYVDPIQGEGKIPIGLMGMTEWWGEDDLIAFGYDCESWLHDGLEGGRVQPRNHADFLDLCRIGTKRNVLEDSE